MKDTIISFGNQLGGWYFIYVNYQPFFKKKTPRPAGAAEVESRLVNRVASEEV